MYTFNIIIKNVSSSEDIEHHTYDYLSMLCNSGQILQREHLLVQKNNTFEIAVACPELNSLDNEHYIPYGLNLKNKIEAETGEKIEFVETGTEPDYPFPRYAVPEKAPSFYILRYGWYSPLIYGDTHTPIPLYKIPYTYSDNSCYDNIWQWKRQQQALYRLWLNSQEVAEEFAISQMQDVHSEHNKTGRKLCSIIEEKTGIPTYYFLYNFRRWTTQEDLERKCPITNKEWRIENASKSDFYAFKCEESRLISELSFDCIDEKNESE